MRYYKQISGAYIITIGVGLDGTEIAEDEYNEILSTIQNHPQAEGKCYKLKTDLTWEEYDLPSTPEPSDEDELSDTEALDIILGGTV